MKKGYLKYSECLPQWSYGQFTQVVFSNLEPAAKILPRVSQRFLDPGDRSDDKLSTKTWSSVLPIRYQTMHFPNTEAIDNQLLHKIEGVG